MHERSFSRRRLLAGLAALSAAGCSGTPSPRLYSLAPRPAATTGNIAETVMMKSVALPRYLDRPQLTRYGAAYQLDAAEFDRWAEPLDAMVTRVLAADLGSRLPRSEFFTGSGALSVPATLRLEVEFSRFEADADGVVMVAAQWAVRRNGKPAQIKSAAFSLGGKSSNLPAPEMVALLSDALGQLSDRIAPTLAG